MCVSVRYVKVYLAGVPSDHGDRPDLAALVGRLGRRLVAMESPVLAAHGVSMWGYVVLTSLGDTPLRAQAALASAIGADKTRIIGVLDDLQERGLIRREPDPADRRVRLLALTPEGRRLRAAVRRDIRRLEEELLGRLAPADREGLLRALRILDD